MTSHCWSKTTRKPGEAGQAILFVLLAMGFVLLGAIAFSVDMGNLWFHRQSAQNVADASCNAAVMDMLSAANGGGSGGFTPGSPFSCSSTPNAAPCKYAAKNMGYAASPLVAGTPGYDVAFKFPSSIPGLATCATGKNAPAVCDASSYTANPFVQVNVDDRVRLSFAGLLSGSTTTDVGAQASCAVVFSNSPVPLLVLNPTVSDAFKLSGTPNVAIYGGPQTSIQVNSSSTSAASGGGSVDLSQGGPDLTGSDFNAVGGPSGACCSFNGGSTGKWRQPAAALSDPFAQIPAPQVPTNVPASAASSGAGATPTTPCPNTATNTYSGFTGCKEYAPGYYANGINVSGTAIFDPGIYYVKGGMSTSPNSCMYPSTATGDGSGGTMFYFADSNAFSIGSNSGKPNKCPFQFNLTSGIGSLQFGAKCTAASSIPANLPATTQGNILLGPCHAPTVSALCAPNCGINYGDSLGTDDPIGEQRGMLFFQNRAQNAGTNPAWGGGGQFLLSGNMYFHQCHVPGVGVTDTGVGCDAVNAYNDQLNFGGNSGSGNFVVGDIVTDQLYMHGTPGITFDLNPSALFYVLKATMLQ